MDKPEGEQAVPTVHEDEVMAVRDVMEWLGLENSRHSSKRVYVVTAPGDKHPDWTKAHADVIFGADTSEQLDLPFGKNE